MTGLGVKGEGQSPLPPNYAVVIGGEDGKPLVSVKMDGTVEFGEKYSAEPAARILWDVFASYLPGGARERGNGLIVDFAEKKTPFGDYIEAVVSMDAKREGRGTSRHKKNAVAYALEDLAKQVMEQGYP